MKRSIRLILACAVSTSILFAESLFDSLNASAIPDETLSTSAETRNAFYYEASSDILLHRLEFYTHSGQGDCTLRVHPDNAGTPGNPLADVTFPLTNTPGFQGADFSAPLRLNAGTAYWLSFQISLSTGTHFAETGTSVPNMTDLNLDGIWDEGPVAWLAPMIKLYGTPAPPQHLPTTFSIFTTPPNSPLIDSILMIKTN